MQQRFSVFIATSLDGFIARANGGIDWLPVSQGSGEDYGYAAFMASVDVLLMGRRTFETVLGFPEWPYRDKPTMVVSRTWASAQVPHVLENKVELHAGPLPELVSLLEDRSVRRAYVDGGQFIQSFMAAGLVTDITVTRVPVLLGTGRPLFGDAGRDIRLAHRATRAYPDGLVQSQYDVIREAP